jgi:hypothetical protein
MNGVGPANSSPADRRRARAAFVEYAAHDRPDAMRTMMPQNATGGSTIAIPREAISCRAKSTAR